MHCSPDLVWGIVRDTGCGIIKKKQSGRSVMGKRGAEFTLEANNPRGINSWKYSGLANEKTVDMTPAETGIVLSCKTKDATAFNKVRAGRRASSVFSGCLRGLTATFSLVQWLWVLQLLARSCRRTHSPLRD